MKCRQEEGGKKWKQWGMINTFREPCPNCPEAGGEKGVCVFPGWMVRWESGKWSPLELEGAVGRKLCLRNLLWCEGLLDQQGTQRRWLSLGRRLQLRSGGVWKWSGGNSDTMEGDLPEIQSEPTVEERRKSNWMWCWRSLFWLKLRRASSSPLLCCTREARSWNPLRLPKRQPSRADQESIWEWLCLPFVPSFSLNFQTFYFIM